MKKAVVILSAALIAGFLLLYTAAHYFFAWTGLPRRVDTSFATSASLRSHKDDRAVDLRITDAREVEALKDILGGWAYKDDPGTICEPSVSITLTDGRKSVTFCIPYDGGPMAEVGETERFRHLSKEQIRLVRNLFRKRGLELPS